MISPGDKLEGKYEVLREIGHGGTSKVYLVLNPRANKMWAAKEIPKQGGGDKTGNTRVLIADASILMNLRHKHIPTIADVLETDDYYYILMDYIEGRTLKDKLLAEGAQPQELVVKWALQIADVFRYLHSCEPQIIYRDTKPSNIILKPDGDVMLIDFGAAREYKPLQDDDTTHLGSRGYAAPEQYVESEFKNQSDERTDIYNLGVTMYHLVTGHNPSQPPYDIYPIRHWDDSLSSGLEKIIIKCTQNNPDNRYQSAQELINDLERYTELDEEYKSRKKRQTVFAAVTAALAGLILAAGLITGAAANRIRDNNYDEMLRSARYATTQEKQTELYRDAITMRPEVGAAYTEYLDRVILADGVFSKSEAEAMTEILGETGKRNRSNESYLKETPDYDLFAYELGLAYYYYYEGEGNKPMSEPWLTTAAESGTLSANRTERAKRLSKICSYYTKLGIRNPAGDPSASYRDYWDDMCALTDGNIVAADNEKTAYVTYREFTYQMFVNAMEFRKAGVTQQELEDRLTLIQGHLKTDFDPGSEEYEENQTAIQANIDNAFSAVAIAFTGRET